MTANVGDWLIRGGGPGRSGQIINLPRTDGSPPYVVRWQHDGHIALVFPGPYDRIVSDGSRTGWSAAGATP
jgi:hypothetical protein